MSDTNNDLIKTLDRIAADQCERAARMAAEGGQWPAALWRALDEVGLVRGALPESAGGSGLDFIDAMQLLRRTAYHAMPVPLAETLLAGRLLLAAGLEVPEGPLTVVPPQPGAPLQVVNGRVMGTVQRVPWGADCAQAVLVAEQAGVPVVARVATDACVGPVEKNLAGEPRVQLVFEAAALLAVAPLPQAPLQCELEGALMRSVQMMGALERALAHSLLYANDRIQFGKPIGKFQAVQHMLAVMAGHVAASSAAVDAAVEASIERCDLFAVAVAKSRVGEAAGKCAEIAHQVHGAMGYTHEHNLHYSTRRLWAWRDEFGNESLWQMRLGRLVCAQGPAALWPLLVGERDAAAREVLA